ncbi:hypothetical protein OT109_13795 [Phycisphaeraceae bacterium D3-23]
MPERTNPAQRPETPEISQENDSIGQEVGKTLAEIAPWAVSIFAHMVLVLLAVFLVWTTVLDEQDPPHQVQASFPQDDLMRPVIDPNPQPSEAEAARATAPILSQQNDPEPIMPRDIGLGETDLPNLRIEIGPYSEFDRNRKPGPGTPGSPILGPTGRQTVFVIDASGSLIDTFPLVVNELKRLLVQLARAEQARLADPAQRNETPFAYSVVFFRDGEVLVEDRRGLRTAGNEAVDGSLAWLDTVSPGGATSPLPALELAMSYGPDTVIVLSDNITGHGIHELSAQTLIDRVLDARGGRRITINTVQFIYPDPQTAYGGKGTLERLADETDGAYRFITDRELNLR